MQPFKKLAKIQEEYILRKECVLLHEKLLLCPLKNLCHLHAKQRMEVLVAICRFHQRMLSNFGFQSL